MTHAGKNNSLRTCEMSNLEEEKSSSGGTGQTVLPSELGKSEGATLGFPKVTSAEIFLMTTVALRGILVRK